MEDCSGTAILGGLDETARKDKAKKSSKSSNSENSSESSSNDNSSSSDSSSNSDSSSENSDSSSQSGETNIPDPVTDPEELIAGATSIQGKRGSENMGIAVFNDDKLCGKLTAIESICHLLIKNEIDSCIVSIDNPYPENNEKKIELNIVPTKKSKVSVKIEDDIPHISVKTNLQASILTLEDDIDYEKDEVLENFSNNTENYLEKEFNDYFNKVSKEYGTDIDCFCDEAFSHFTTIKEWKDFNWSEKFKSAKFDIDVDVNVISSMLITKT